MLLPKILTHIPFLPKHSTCTALSTITADIAAGFSRKKPAHRTVLIALDHTAAFDNVEHQQLLDCVFNTNIGNNPSAIQLYAEQTSQGSFSNTRILKQKGENMSGTRWISVSSALQLLSGRLSNTASKHQADQVRRLHYHIPVVADLINGLNIYLMQVLNYINNKKQPMSTANLQ